MHSPESRWRLMEYHLWRQEKVLTVLEKAGAELADRKADISFGSLHGLVHHLAVSEETWFLRVFPDASPVLAAKPAGSPLPGLADAWRTISRRWLRTVEEEEPGFWARETAYTNTSGLTFRNTVDEIFAHMVDHTTYHTGQFMSGARSLGLEPLPATMIFFFREKN